VKKSTVAIVPADTPHEYGASEDDPWSIWWCHLRGTDLPDLVVGTGATQTSPTVALRYPERAVALIDGIIQNLERDQSPACLTAIAGMAWNLLTVVSTEGMLPRRGDPLERAMSYLASNLGSKVAVPDLASYVGLSAGHLSFLFNQATGSGVLAYHTALKMARARELLDETNLGIAEVAREIGYDDAFYFSRAFKKMHGTSPRAYRDHGKG
jgi:AraC family transcriptional regulator of arabinose operon